MGRVSSFLGNLLEEFMQFMRFGWIAKVMQVLYMGLKYFVIKVLPKIMVIMVLKINFMVHDFVFEWIKCNY